MELLLDNFTWESFTIEIEIVQFPAVIFEIFYENENELDSEILMKLLYKQRTKVEDERKHSANSRNRRNNFDFALRNAPQRSKRDS